MLTRAHGGIAAVAAFALALPLITAISASADESTAAAGRYIVRLVDEAVATASGEENFDPHSVETAEASAAIVSVQDDVARDAGVKSVDTHVSIAFNGFASHLTAAQVASLADDPRVAELMPDGIVHADARTPDELTDLSGSAGLWSQVGGESEAGEGIVIGVIDSGISPENPAFAGDSLGVSAGAEPYLDGNDVVFEKADGGTFRAERTGTSADGAWSVNDYSTKLIGARVFTNGIDTLDVSPDETLTPRGHGDHGEHTASTAAGNAATLVDGTRTMSGVAPVAKIASYKALFQNSDKDSSAGTISALLAAIDQAVADGVDVINYSISDTTLTSYSAVSEAFLGAASAGVFVAASAGNSGTAASTVQQQSPWVTSVAASTGQPVRATVSTRLITVGGASATRTSVTGDLVLAASLAIPGKTNANLCQAGTLGNATGKIVICDRGDNDRVNKAEVVAAAGGIGVVLRNTIQTSSNLVADDHTAVPMVHVSRNDGINLAAMVGAPATIAPGSAASIADFSSRGASAGDPDMLKPDVAAPGVAVMAAYSNRVDETPKFGAMDGTSMAAPHVAGFAAVYLSAHPEASPSEIKSALMTSAQNTVTATGSRESAFAEGAGAVNASRYLNPGLVYLNGPIDWSGYLLGLGFDAPVAGAVAIDGSDINLPSIAIGALTHSQTVTRTVTARTSGTYTAQASVPGFDVAVSPTALTLDAGESASFTVTFTRTDAAPDAWAQGSLTWTGAGHAVRSPIALRATALVVPAYVAGTGASGSAAADVRSGVDAEVSVTAGSIVAEQRVLDTKSVNGHTRSVSGTDNAGWRISVPAARTSLAIQVATSGADVKPRVDLYRNMGTTTAPSWTYLGSAATQTGGPLLMRLASVVAGEYLLQVGWHGAPAGTMLDIGLIDPLAPVAVGAVTSQHDVLDLDVGALTRNDVEWAGITAPSDVWSIMTYDGAGVTARTYVEISPEETTTPSPTTSPSKSPSATPSSSPTATPSTSPSAGPTKSPSAGPTKSPSAGPTATPSTSPTAGPSKSPTAGPSPTPSKSPTADPSASPTATPGNSPTAVPSSAPPRIPSSAPSEPTGSPNVIIAVPVAPTDLPSSPGRAVDSGEIDVRALSGAATATRPDESELDDAMSTTTPTATLSPTVAQTTTVPSPTPLVRASSAEPADAVVTDEPAGLSSLPWVIAGLVAFAGAAAGIFIAVRRSRRSS